MLTRTSTRQAGCHLKLVASMAVLAQAGLMTAALAMPAPSIAAVAALSRSMEAGVAQPILYLAQNSNDGYATVPHLRPRPEVPANSGTSTSGTTSGSGGGAVAPRVVRPAAPAAPRDSRDSDRK